MGHKTNPIGLRLALISLHKIDMLKENCKFYRIPEETSGALRNDKNLVQKNHNIQENLLTKRFVETNMIYAYTKKICKKHVNLFFVLTPLLTHMLMIKLISRNTPAWFGFQYNGKNPKDSSGISHRLIGTQDPKNKNNILVTSNLTTKDKTILIDNKPYKLTILAEEIYKPKLDKNGKVIPQKQYEIPYPNLQKIKANKLIPDHDLNDFIKKHPEFTTRWDYRTKSQFAEMTKKI